jgi:hypothetical protein
MLCINCRKPTELVNVHSTHYTYQSVGVWIDEYECPECGRKEKTTTVWECLEEGKNEKI